MRGFTSKTSERGVVCHTALFCAPGAGCLPLAIGRAPVVGARMLPWECLRALARRRLAACPTSSRGNTSTVVCETNHGERANASLAARRCVAFSNGSASGLILHELVSVVKGVFEAD